MISEIAVERLKDLDKKELLLLKFLNNDKIILRQHILISMRSQFRTWCKNPEHLTPLSQKQWSYLLSQYVGYRRYTDLLDKIK